MDQTQGEIGGTKRRSAEVQELSDKDLVAEVLRKDRKATAEFVARYADRIYGYVRRRLLPRADLVEDLVQDVFLAAWEDLGKFRGDSPLQDWLLGIAHHKVEDHYRKRLRELQLREDDENPGADPVDFRGMEDVFERRQTEHSAREILARLPESYSVILLWKYWEGRSLREIAAQTGKTEKAIERLLARARHQFKKRWNEQHSSARR
ncbi:MAG: RNA polymerase sigma factor [Terriglobia bacterium]